MKKLAYISVFAGLLLTGCIAGDYGIKSADPQEWGQENPVTLPSLSISGVSPIDIAAVEEDSVAVATLSPVTLPEGASLDRYKIVLDEAVEVSVDASMRVAKADLQAAVERLYGKRPVAREFSSVLKANVMVEGQASLLVSNEISVTVTPEAPFISSAYYLVGDMCGWDSATAIKLQHSEADVYDDPVFTVTFSTPKAGCYWKLIPEENYSGNNFWAEGVKGVVGVAVDGDISLEGILVTSAPQAGKIADAGLFKLTINMMDYTYTLAPMAAEYYLVGALNGWNDAEEGKYCLLYPESETVFSYTTNWTGHHNFKIWTGSGYGDWDVAIGTLVDGDNSPEGVLGGAGAIATPTAAYYTVTFDMAANSYRSVMLDNQNPAEYGSVSLIGDFNGWGGDIDLAEGASHNWYVLGAAIPSDGTLKFRADHDWAISWGGDNVDLNVSDKNYGSTTSKDGKNIFVPAGTYDIFFNDITGQFVFLGK